jgi:hypothetical protein
MFHRKSTDARATDAPVLTSCTKRSHSASVQSAMIHNLEVTENCLSGAQHCLWEK